MVLGAGPAGACAAALMAEGGLKVALVDRQPRGQAGAQWVNGVASWFFEAAGIEPPQPPELLGSGQAFTLISPQGDKRVTVHDNPIWEVDMRLLGQRMAQKAQDAGALLLWQTRAQHLGLSSEGRPTELQVRTPEGPLRLEARLYVDASGLGAWLRRQIPEMTWACPRPDPSDLCAAAQQVHEVADPDGARSFLGQHRGQPGETLAWTGVEGGYSVLNVRVDASLRHVSILTGAIAQPQRRSGQRMLDDFLAGHPWIGQKLFGGSRAIPLRRPYTRLVAPGVALLGDAACQVYTAHGSGIGIGLIAASLLAHTAVQAQQRRQDIGALRSLWPYAARFHQRWMPLLGGADVMRRFSQGLDSPALEKMLGGLISPSMARDTLAQDPARLHPEDSLGLLKAALRDPGSALKMIPVLARLPLLEVVAQTYPVQDSSHAQVDLYRYERRLRWLVDSV